MPWVKARPVELEAHGTTDIWWVCLKMVELPTFEGFQ
jgi:hypothetical protein